MTATTLRPNWSDALVLEASRALHVAAKPLESSEFSRKCGHMAATRYNQPQPVETRLREELGKLGDWGRNHRHSSTRHPGSAMHDLGVRHAEMTKVSTRRVSR